MKNHKGVAIAAAALMIVVAAVFSGVAIAQSSDSPIYAAVNSQTGMLRIVSGPDATLRANEYLLEWNQVGPPGPPGPAGEQGLAGPAGADGEDGGTASLGAPTLVPVHPVDTYTHNTGFVLAETDGFVVAYVYSPFSDKCSVTISAGSSYFTAADGRERASATLPVSAGQTWLAAGSDRDGSLLLIVWFVPLGS